MLYFTPEAHHNQITKSVTGDVADKKVASLLLCAFYSLLDMNYDLPIHAQISFLMHYSYSYLFLPEVPYVPDRYSGCHLSLSISAAGCNIQAPGQFD
jgi:hypothetical protein